MMYLGFLFIASPLILAFFAICKEDGIKVVSAIMGFALFLTSMVVVGAYLVNNA